MSPLLFALYIAEIGNIFDEQDDPMVIGNTPIPAMLFADDLVIISKSKVGLLTMIMKVQLFMEKKLLEINFDKTKIMIMGGIEKTRQSWTVRDRNDNILGEIQQTEIYRYLGMNLDNNGNAVKILQEAKVGLARKIALTQLTAKHTPDSIWTTDALWRQSMRPAILYATEVTDCLTEWINQIEVAQNSVARWAIGASPSAPIAGLRGEMGWPTILG